MGNEVIKENNKLTRIKFLLKGILLTCLIIGLFMLLGVFAINHQDSMNQIQQSFRHHWYWWLLLRLMLYGVCIVLGYITYQRIRNSDDKATFKRIMWMGIAFIIVTEVVKFAL